MRYPRQVYKRVAIFVVEGFTDSGLSIALDVLRTANALCERADRTAPFRIQVASATGGRLRAASGLVIERTRVAARTRADIVLVPGFWAEHPDDLEPVLRRPEVVRLTRAIAGAYARGALVASACAGAFLLADAGLLDRKQATTTWWLAEALRRRRPQVALVPDAALIIGRRIVTGGAVFAQADVALHVVSRFAGAEIAQQCARLLLLDAHPSQAPYMAAQHLRASDPLVQKAERWVRAHLGERFDMQTLARQVGMSPRTLARRLHAATGLGPVAFVQRLRIETAVSLLETSPCTLSEISAHVGYADASTLSRLIRREVGVPARELRRRGRALR